MIDLDNKDLEYLKEKGITPEQLEQQLNMLATGFPYLDIVAPATVGHGLFRMTDQMAGTCINLWNEYTSGKHTIVKMVPASGAASRMFKSLYEFYKSDRKKSESDDVKKFFAEIDRFAFFERLNWCCLRLYGKSVLGLIEEGRYKDILEALLETPGLNYGNMPKALIQFHNYFATQRTAMEEHLAEGAQYAADKDGKVRIHFTVSEQHLPYMQWKLEEKQRIVEKRDGVELDVTFSEQKPSTDTVAMGKDGKPYREDGNLFFRPGGHGALIENLNDLEADIVFLKNIDNVVPDAKREDTIRFKKIIGGALVGVKTRIDEYCRLLAEGKPTPEQLMEMLKFATEVLSIDNPEASTYEPDKLRDFLYKKFNRPTRVCGMVLNEGEPGGGPFLVRDSEGTVAPQILESTQLNPKKAKELLKESSHFNPVDLVCAVRDYNGRKFNLPDYVDHATAFISEKSRGGVEIKALELPGLWNGAMADWNTIFIEVPATTFNPVKVVNDLLRPVHINEK